MQFGNFQFAPTPVIAALYFAVGVTMLVLGAWQMQRAAEKIELQASADEASVAAPLSLDEITDSENLANYTRVGLKGQFEPGMQLLWDNRTYKGRAGFEVITPFRLMSGRLVLVNRGWIPPGSSRQELPSVTFKSMGTSSFNGIFVRPSKGFSSGDALVFDSVEWPRILQHFSYGDIARVLGEPTLDGVVQVERTASNGNLQESGVALYQDNWQPVAFGPERHYGYAFQWWAMFVTLTVLFVVLNTRKR